MTGRYKDIPTIFLVLVMFFAAILYVAHMGAQAQGL